MTEIEVFYPTDRDIPNWETAYGLGKVPDLWPYGLHQLGSQGKSPVPIQAKPLRPIQLARALFTNSSSMWREAESRPVIAWDEDLALRVAVERPTAPKMAGVIWATDRHERGKRTAKDLLLRRVLPRFRGLWMLSQAQLEITQDWLGRSTPPLDWVRFGIDEQFFGPYTYPEKPLVLSIGRDRDRDSETLFRALEEIRQARPDVDIAVQAFSDRPLPSGVRSLPMMPHAELRALYRRASVVVVATKHNLHVSGMTVALESMATARPIVITATPGMNDYVEDNLTGLLVKPFDAKGLAERVLAVLADPIMGEKMGAQGRKKVEQQHTSRQMASRLRHIALARASGTEPQQIRCP